MNKKYSLILAALITVLIANSIYLLSSSDNSSLEKGIVARVIDGDTLELKDGSHVRLLNINSPEKSSPLFRQAKDYLSNFENQEISLDYNGKDKYSRDLARIYYQGNYVNLDIAKKGLASKFLVDSSELNDFDSAESYAVSNQLGIWNHSSFYGCLSADIDESNELISISLRCDSINLNGWTLKDESRKEYKFHIILSSVINVHSNEGNDNATDIYWNSKTPVWNDDRDTIYIFDSENNIVLAESYGY